MSEKSVVNIGNIPLVQSGNPFLVVAGFYAVVLAIMMVGYYAWNYAPWYATALYLICITMLIPVVLAIGTIKKNARMANKCTKMSYETAKTIFMLSMFITPLYPLVALPITLTSTWLLAFNLCDE